MQITTTKKKFLIAGYEIVIDFSKDFAEEMIWIHSELKRSLERIGNIIEPMRLIGFWQPWQACMVTPNHTNTPKGKYFFGVEVSNLNDIPSDCVVKVIPDSEYAVYREEKRGTAPKAEMYAVPGYEPNYIIAGDFEIFDDFEHIGVSDFCDILVPIKLKS